MFLATLHRMVLDCDLVQGEVDVGVLLALPIEGLHLILGNGLAGSRVWADSPPSPVVTLCPSEFVSNKSSGALPEVSPACVVTRAMHKLQLNGLSESNNVNGPLEVPSLAELPGGSVSGFSLSCGEVVQEQCNDVSLKEIFRCVLPALEISNVASGYFLHKELLFRKWVPVGEDGLKDVFFQVVVPAKFRWSAYIKTWHVCQLTGKPNQSIKPAPLQPIPVVREPFTHLIVDCVGPLHCAKSGCKYLLTVMCKSTRYPAAYPLRTIMTKSVVRALTQFISIFGNPKVIHSDQGSNFTAHMFGQVLKLLRIKQNNSSTYHAQSQGALERFHQTLKSLLRACCTELDRDWEDGLPWLMLAVRGAVQDSTGFSLNELVFGHTVRGPLAVLKSEEFD